MSSPSMGSYWCYSCTRFVSIGAHSDTAEADDDAITCPYCDGGFVEEIDEMRPDNSGSDLSRRFPASALHVISNSNSEDPGQAPARRSRRSRRNANGRSPFNPVIVLRVPADAGDDESNSFELYYDDGAGSGLRPLPTTISDFLMGAGFDRILESLTHIEMTNLHRTRNPPASKAVVESMPRIEITDTHVSTDIHCAVCKEPFELHSEGREMPCKHIYHPDCILPWLSMRNSCPVCRHELPTEPEEASATATEQEEIVGLTIWRLPGGGYAVGRFSGGRRGGDTELPVVFTEMDGGFNRGETSPMVPWVTTRRSRNGGFRGLYRGLASFFGRFRSRSNSSSSPGSVSLSSGSMRRSFSLSNSVFGRRRRRGLDLEGGEIERW
ncbi:E3 ubiquitin-protein ligase RING1 [Tripterygium wilfordii]|uniref:RING-type E3 ubiquitin transferase n=1 Tax=Tripterygium wilfordii TaxID=458696 RepID=A0A7J7BZR6_TRIWF|nr:E3 ubiquitin-protein ligase RDUF2-like [Tripterygium wilfordii]KAF5727373.1 E3 ubiquitin-protein ligase RING1 [Tripterygium wilfordii]